MLAGNTLFAFLSVVLIINVVNACWKKPPKQRCCPEIQTGFCFDLKNRLLNPDPVCPSTYSPTFTLFTRSATSGITISKDNIPSAFSNNRRTVFIVHGWTGSFNSDFMTLKNEALRKDDLNVIAVDWRNGASAITYLPAAANTQTIGALIGAMTNSLRARPGSSPNFWCIGHSLGAHVCGHSNQTAQPLLERITGADPAGPYFGITEGLVKTSAIKVDIIHTDPLIGSLNPRGHVDFYPNGGRSQPGCAFSIGITGRDENSLSDAEKLKIMQKSLRERGSLGCSHQRALFYMTQSIRDTSCYDAQHVCTDYRNMPGSCTQIPANQQKGVMGYDAINYRYSGYHYFRPNTTSPYCSI